jgi:exodeoxyribonuclease III
VRFYSWNVNGIRSALRRGFLEWLEGEQPEVLCIQETKAAPDDLPEEVLHPKGYVSHWAIAQKKGYSGVATYTRHPVTRWQAGLGIERLDTDGRLMMTEIGGIELYNVYFPNGKASPERLALKYDFYDAFIKFVNERVAEGHPVVFCGDVNTAHKEIDIARPKENEKISGFLPEERACMDRWIEQGWIDSFRHFYPDKAQAYSWWSLRTGARKRNVGWRLDYFFVHESLLPRLEGAGIMSEVTGADHCPVWIELRD